MFSLNVADESGKVHVVGSVKIGRQGLLPGATPSPGHRTPEIPEAFDALDQTFFSLGQGEDYYVTLNELNPALKARVLTGLRDCAFDLSIFETNQQEDVMVQSLLRDVRAENVVNRLHRITRGNAKLTEFRFSYTFPEVEGAPPAVMTFEVIPDSQPPTNVHVLIGRNGAGKTVCMRQIAQSLLGRTTKDGKSPGVTELDVEAMQEWAFAGVVLISFSAFDDFDLRATATDLMGSKQVSLRRTDDVGDGGGGTVKVKSFKELGADFATSLWRIRGGLPADRWLAVIATLEADDLFAEAGVSSLLDGPFDEDHWKRQAGNIFEGLSSGHAIILLAVTRLVELVDEKTLVLLDEPEGHLHPPLLSAFIRCLSDLLVKRNGVAIVATHSPVVLQEVPRSCAWKMRRSRQVVVVERPTTETFGENIGVLTREAFGLDVTNAGFHQLLKASVDQGLGYQAIVNRFNGQLGAEAKAIAHALIAERDNGEH